MSKSQKEFLLVKRGLYYMPDSKGYTGVKRLAGRYLESDAMPECDVTAIHQDIAQQFSDACYDDVKLAELNSIIDGLEKSLHGLVEGIKAVGLPHDIDCSCRQSWNDEEFNSCNCYLSDIDAIIEKAAKL